MVIRPLEMEKYIRTGGKRPVVIKEAPEKFKEIARKTNEEYKEIAGEEYYIIEEADSIEAKPLIQGTKTTR